MKGAPTLTAGPRAFVVVTGKTPERPCRACELGSMGGGESDSKSSGEGEAYCEPGASGRA